MKNAVLSAKRDRPKEGEVWLNLGSGIGLLSGFTNVDLLPKAEIYKGFRTKKGFFAQANIEDGAEYVEGNLVNLPFPDNYASYILSTEVLEHQAIRYVQKVVDEMYRVLKPGGKVVITTPDFNSLARLWVENIADKVGTYTNFDQYRNIAEIIYGNQAHDGEFHRCPMTPDFVNYLFKVAGFKEVKVFVWPIYSKPGYKYPGMRWPKNAILRSPTIVAEGIK